MKNAKAPTNTRKGRLLVVALGASLFLNFILIVILNLSRIISDAAVSVLEDDFAIVNRGLVLYCSEEFKTTVKNQYESQDNKPDGDEVLLHLAYIDFTCDQNNSSEYRLEGFKDYLRSQDIPFDEENF